MRSNRAVGRIDSYEDQIDFITAHFGRAHKLQPVPACQRGFHHEALTGIQVKSAEPDRFAAGGVRITGIQLTRDSVGIEQTLAADQLDALGK